MEQFGLTERTLSQIKIFLAQYPEIVLVKVYGSRAMGTYWRGSDIDLAIYGECENLLGEIITGLDELATPYKFDVTDYEHVENVELKEHIDRIGKIIYSR